EQEGELVDDATVARANYTSLPRAVSGTIVRPPRGWTLEDLKLPEVQKQTLRHVCAQVLRRHQVYDEWGMEGKFPYGKAVAALFVGPSGTGKTMAANILASTLGLSLYRVDLSRVVDKYIGETEKRLEQIFTAAEKSNSILFFDEADSIFGKRSQVKEANDRFANIQVSYILQRLEDYDGVVILASNLRSNIDEAFMRRMRYVVEFQIPGEELRRELWQSGFAPQVPQENIDYDYLARQFELAGGAIKNIALNATFLAADEEHAVTMKDILDSVRGENLKMGKAMLAQDFAEYSALQR
ncbi:MAG: AAA family ATPase, partial [Angelakisella sp.]